MSKLHPLASGSSSATCSIKQKSDSKTAVQSRLWPQIHAVAQEQGNLPYASCSPFMLSSLFTKMHIVFVKAKYLFEDLAKFYGLVEFCVRLYVVFQSNP